MLKLNNIGFIFNKSNWRCNYSLSLEKYDMLGIMGPSGSGKSTLLNLIAGFTKILSGSLFIDGEDFTYVEPSKRPVNILFQEYNLFEHLTVYENIAVGISPSLKLTAEEIDIVNFSLNRLGLNGFNKRFPIQLSGGQRQRVAIARAMVRKIPILLLDEPFSFLDPNLRLEMLDLVKEIHQEKKLTTIVVTHDFKDCQRVCNKTAFIEHGKLIHQDNTGKFVASGYEKEPIRSYLGL